ncbi:MAG: hypothetical protein JSW46_01960 [Gemmatimonadota bacterium]|nr:MAG: hypothetical protein JSW46_01960 [Gemmatimonadota bacterium]
MTMLHNTTKRFPRVAPILLVAFGAVACSDETGSITDPGELGNITLDVRVHLLESDQFAALDATLTDSDVAVLFEGVNEIWSQAGITWRVESVVREPSLDGTSFIAALNGVIPVTGSVLASILPSDNLLAGRWNVFVIRDFGNFAGGVYLDFRGAVIFAENGPIGPQDPTSDGRRILAHELGHSLSLFHVPCTSAGNLMAPGCPAQDRTRLEPGQITPARAQAQRGRPFGI